MEMPAHLEPPVEPRTNPRTNMFVAAVLKTVDGSVPVRIRNLSSVGALVEGAVMPAAGSAVSLARGCLATSAEVVWSADNRCGLRFLSLVSVRDWMAPPANTEQARVDNTVRLLRAGAIPLAVCGESSAIPRREQLGRDLRSVVRLVEAIGDDLAGNPATVSSHADELQKLDIALQMIASVANILAGDAEAEPVAARLANLRLSCREALEGGG